MISNHLVFRRIGNFLMVQVHKFPKKSGPVQRVGLRILTYGH